MATTAVEFDDFQLIGISPRGGRLKVLEVTGWMARSLRRTRETRAQQDGDFPSSGAVASRAITISGSATYGNPADAAVERRQIAALGGRGTRRLVISDADSTLRADVETDVITITPITDTFFLFTLLLTAPDPTLYGPDLFSTTSLEGATVGTGRAWPRLWTRSWGIPDGVPPGGLALLNGGTTAYWPRLRIDGPVPNPTIQLAETGDWIRYNATLAAGQFLDIDLGARRVLLNGNLSVSSRITYSGNWLAVPPGGGYVTWTADGADPAAGLSIYSYEGAYL